MVVLDRVAKRYGRAAPVFADLDLTVQDGELTVIIGANGCGKSTLMRIVVGVLRPTSGHVRGRPRRLGYLPGPFPNGLGLSAKSYLRHMSALRGIAGDRAHRRADEMLDRLGFAGDRTAPIRTLSKGNAQKVGLTQALLPEDGFVALDEPWSGLDPSARLVLDTMLIELLADGRTALVTDHTGHAERLPGGNTLRMVAGSLTELSGRESVVLVELSCPSAVQGRIAALPGVVSARDREDGVLAVTVAASGSDSLLAEALRLGCSVRTVLS